MSERRKRWTFSEAFKAEAVRLVRDEVRPWPRRRGRSISPSGLAPIWQTPGLSCPPEPVNKSETRDS